MAFNPNSISLQPVEISALMKQIETAGYNKISPSVMLNCVLGANALFIESDPVLIKDVLNKFVDNAAKFTEKGSITFGYDVSDDEVYFYVKDTGVGVPRSEQDEIFEDDGTKSDSSLIQAKQIVEALGGEIGVDSRGAGKGSTFWFTIPNTPAAQPDNTADALPSYNSNAYEATSPIISSNAPSDVLNMSAPVSDQPYGGQDNGHDVTILIAEDNESNFLLFRSILESRYNIIHAYNGQEAVDLFKEYNVDLILMDINMPLKDGYEATREIREVSTTVPIVAVTAYAFTTDKQRIFENGFNGYVSKPISINRLERVINDLLAR